MTEHSLRPRLIKAADTTGRAIELSSGAVCVVLGAAMVTVTLLGVFFRYVLGSPLQWTEEAGPVSDVVARVSGHESRHAPGPAHQH